MAAPLSNTQKLNYTYDEFETALNASGLRGNFSQYDLDLAKQNPTAGMGILQAKKDFQSATTDSQKALANYTAEQIRQEAGYQGGQDGSGYYTVPQKSTTVISKNESQSAMGTSKPQQSAISGGSSGKIDYSGVGGQVTPKKQGSGVSDYYAKTNTGYNTTGEGAGMSGFETYQPKYEAEINALSNKVASTEEYGGYDPEADPLYASYKKQYLREAQRAQEDTMAKYAANTGGLASTAAVTASQQAFQYYATQLTDKIPELAQMDYNQWYNTQQLMIQKLSAMQSLENANYSIYASERQAAQTYAELSAQYGDYSAMQALGIDTTTAEFERAMTNALTIADSTGDTTYLAALGVDTTYLDTQYADATYARKLEIAAAEAQLGDTGAMKALGLDTAYYDMKLQNELNTEQLDMAVTRWKALGYADEEVSAVLGVPVGTPTTDQSYRDWEKQTYEQEYADQRADVAYNRELDEREYALKLANTEYDKQLNRVEALGYVDEEAARVLGVPAGTSLSELDGTSSSGGNAETALMLFLAGDSSPESEALICSAMGVDNIEQAKMIMRTYPAQYAEAFGMSVEEFLSLPALQSTSAAATTPPAVTMTNGPYQITKPLFHTKD